MGIARRQFTDEFRREAVWPLASGGRPLRQIAGEPGMAGSRLRACRNRGAEWRNAGSPRRSSSQAAIPPAGADLAAENARPRRENERPRMEPKV
jgi:transposase